VAGLIFIQVAPFHAQVSVSTSGQGPYPPKRITAPMCASKAMEADDRADGALAGIAGSRLSRPKSRCRCR
jgi:hypothetical protein